MFVYSIFHHVLRTGFSSLPPGSHQLFIYIFSQPFCCSASTKLRIPEDFLRECEYIITFCQRQGRGVAGATVVQNINLHKSCSILRSSVMDKTFGLKNQAYQKESYAKCFQHNGLKNDTRKGLMRVGSQLTRLSDVLHTLKQNYRFGSYLPLNLQQHFRN